MWGVQAGLLIVGLRDRWSISRERGRRRRSGRGRSIIHTIYKLHIGHVVHVAREGWYVLGQVLGVRRNPLEEQHRLLRRRCVLHASANAVVTRMLLFYGCLERGDQAQALFELAQQISRLMPVLAQVLQILTKETNKASTQRQM